MATGTIKRINIDRGFGFIKRDDGGGDVFLHAMQVRGAYTFEQLEMGMRLSFDINNDEAKGPRAFNVRVLGGKESDDVIEMERTKSALSWD